MSIFTVEFLCDHFLGIHIHWVVRSWRWGSVDTGVIMQLSISLNCSCCLSRPNKTGQVRAHVGRSWKSPDLRGLREWVSELSAEGCHGWVWVMGKSSLMSWILTQSFPRTGSGGNKIIRIAQQQAGSTERGSKKHKRRHNRRKLQERRINIMAQVQKTDWVVFSV